MRHTLLFSVAALLLPLFGGLLMAAEVKTSEVKIKSGEEEIKGFLAVPEGEDKYPAIVMIQEWWGLNDWIKDNAKRLAGQGYIVLAPDLYRGKVAEEPAKAGELMKGLPKDRALRDLKGAVSFLVDQPGVKKDKIGCIGWCMGGGYALDLSLDDKRVSACVICYGRTTTEANKLKGLNAAVLGIFGEDDKGIPADGVKKFEEALKKADKKVESIQIYKGAGHGFMRTANPNKKENPEYREEQAKDAWKRIDAFFEKTLKK